MGDVGKDPQLSTLIKMNSPDSVRDEVLVILNLLSIGHDVGTFTRAFQFTINLYNGNFPGYQACNTEYHDLQHTANTLLALTRLIHGAVISGIPFTERLIFLSLIAALGHDTGYIQHASDSQGTGAKYTADHVQRSIDFMERHAKEYTISSKEIPLCRLMILCTDLENNISQHLFPSPKVEILSKMLNNSDLFSQMADRAYLERLLFLYREFKEALVGDYENELDLLKKTLLFYDVITNRIKEMEIETDKFLTSHFKSRWGIQENLYDKAIQRQQKYLQQILALGDSDPFAHLKRDNIVEHVRQRYGIDVPKPG